MNARAAQLKSDIGSGTKEQLTMLFDEIEKTAKEGNYFLDTKMILFTRTRGELSHLGYRIRSHGAETFRISWG